MPEESKESGAVVFYFSNRNGYRVKVSREEWEREWLSWWKRTSPKRGK